MKIKIKKIKCLRCGHEWIPRKVDVRMCPKCKTPYFDKPRHGRAGFDEARHSKAGMIRRGKEGSGRIWQGKAGEVRIGEEGTGAVRIGADRHSKAGKTMNGAKCSKHTLKGGYYAN